MVKSAKRTNSIGPKLEFIETEVGRRREGWMTWTHIRQSGRSMLSTGTNDGNKGKLFPGSGTL